MLFDFSVPRYVDTVGFTQLIDKDVIQLTLCTERGDTLNTTLPGTQVENLVTSLKEQGFAFGTPTPDGESGVFYYGTRAPETLEYHPFSLEFTFPELKEE